MLDRMRIEQDVNVYLSARYVSRNRPQFFDNIVSSGRVSLKFRLIRLD